MEMRQTQEKDMVEMYINTHSWWLWSPNVIDVHLCLPSHLFLVSFIHRADMSTKKKKKKIQKLKLVAFFQRMENIYYNFGQHVKLLGAEIFEWQTLFQEKQGLPFHMDSNIKVNFQMLSTAGFGSMFKRWLVQNHLLTTWL